MKTHQTSTTIAQRTAVRVFLAISFAAVLLLCAPALLGVDADYLVVATPLAQWIPALAVLVAAGPLRRRMHRSSLGRTSVKDLWRLVPLNGPRTWIAVALVTLAVASVAGAQILVGVATGVVRWSPDPALGTTAFLILPVAFLALLSASGEEFGWRGFLWTQVRGTRGFWWTAAGIGLVWAAWHIPLLLTYGIQGDLAWRTVLATTIDLIAASLVLGAARELAGNVWAAAWGHALVNSALVFAATNFVTPADARSDGAFWLYKAIGWAAWIGATFGMLSVRRAVEKAPRTDADGRTLDEAEDDLQKAMRAGDTHALRSLLAEDLRFRLPDGSVIDRATDLERHASGATRFVSLREQGRETVQRGDEGGTTSRAHVVVVDHGSTIAATMIYRRSWSIAQGRWQVVDGRVDVAGSNSE